MATKYVVECECGWTCRYSKPGRAQYGLSRHRCPEPAREHRRRCESCGWSGTFKTAGIANRSKRSHSCERQMQLKGQRLRGDFRRSMIDHTPKPCLHKIANHQHGTHACYVLDQCKCLPCSQANREYENQRNRQHAYGRWDNYVDAEPVRQHIRSLRAQGMGLKRLIAAHGLSGGQLNKLLYGHTKPDGSRRPPARRVTKKTAERILAIELDLADGATVSSDDTARRMQALVACGWSQKRLATRLGVNQSNFGPVVQGTRDVTVATAKAVYALYVELVDQVPQQRTKHERGSVAMARNYAKRMGWAPPLRINGKAHIGSALPTPWAESNLDELESIGFDEAAVLRRLAGDHDVPLSKVERIEVVRRARALGWSLLDIERRTGIAKAERYLTSDPTAVAS